MIKQSVIVTTRPAGVVKNLSPSSRNMHQARTRRTGSGGLRADIKRLPSCVCPTELPERLRIAGTSVPRDRLCSDLDDIPAVRERQPMHARADKPGYFPCERSRRRRRAEHGPDTKVPRDLHHPGEGNRRPLVRQRAEACRVLALTRGSFCKRAYASVLG